MMSKFAQITCAFITLSTLSAFAAADKMPKNFLGGSSADLKTWSGRTFESFKSTPGAYCIYIFDADRKNNSHAYHVEGKDMLGSAEVKEVLSKFIKLKIPNNSKDWPEQWRKDAEGGAILVLVSGDMVTVFDKKVPAAEFTAQAIVGAAKAVRAHQDVIDKAQKARDEQKEKEAAEKAKKEPKEVASKDPTAIPGLDPKKPDPKPSKKPDPGTKPDDKKVADGGAKKPDGKPTDPKDPKKKLPEDE